MSKCQEMVLLPSCILYAPACTMVEDMCQTQNRKIFIQHLWLRHQFFQVLKFPPSFSETSHNSKHSSTQLQSEQNNSKPLCGCATIITYNNINNKLWKLNYINHAKCSLLKVGVLVLCGILHNVISFANHSESHLFNKIFLQNCRRDGDQEKAKMKENGKKGLCAL